jgi:hypothetical protein
MYPNQPTTPDPKSLAESASSQGAFHRFFAGWRRLEAAMGYGPFDYTIDRLRGLEVRIDQLERRLGAALEDSSAQTPISTALETSSDRG